jgi:CheY-like chemotaxis protein
MSLPTRVHLDLRRAADNVDHGVDVFADYLGAAEDRAHAVATVAVELLAKPVDRVDLAHALAEAVARLHEAGGVRG